MAVVAAVPSPLKTIPQGVLITWTLTSVPTTDTFEAVEWGGTGDRSIQAFGAVGATGFNGSTVTIQGSNDGTNWVTLTDPSNTAITFTASGLKQVTEITRYIRPSLSVATGGSSTFTVTLFARR